MCAVVKLKARYYHVSHRVIVRVDSGIGEFGIFKFSAAKLRRCYRVHYFIEQPGIAYLYTVGYRVIGVIVGVVKYLKWRGNRSKYPATTPAVRKRQFCNIYASRLV